MIAECTLPEKILLAGFQLEEHGQSPFSAEALIVSAWQKYPRTFGLKGFTDQYPDSNKVLASIMGAKGLTRRGWLSRIGEKLYALTREGRLVVRRLQLGDEPPERPAGPIRLAEEHDRRLQALFLSPALQKFQEGRKPELTFPEACRFWGISDNLHGDAIDARLDALQRALADVERHLGSGSATLANGRSVTAADAGLLLDVHTYLEERFARHLTLLRTRGAPR
jgi:hypothetical protein